MAKKFKKDDKVVLYKIEEARKATIRPENDPINFDLSKHIVLTVLSFDSFSSNGVELYRLTGGKAIHAYDNKREEDIFEFLIPATGMLKVATEPPKTKKYWLSYVGETDDFGDTVSDIIIDGKTKDGPWALFTPASYEKHAMWPGAFGTGIGQKYQKQADGKWLKIEG